MILEEVTQFLLPHHGGYWLLFAIIVLEALPVIGLFIPGQTLLILTGFAARNHLIHVHSLIIVAALAAFIGDCIAYYLGRHYGLSLLTKYGKYFFFKKEYIPKTKEYMKRFLGPSIILGRIKPVTRGLVPFFAGAHKTDLKKFIVANAVGSIIWAALFVSIGFLLGRSYKLAEHYIGGVLIAGIVLAFVIYGVYYIIAVRMKLLSKRDLTLVLIATTSLIFFSSIVEDIHTHEFWFTVDLWVNAHIAVLQKPLLLTIAQALGFAFDTGTLLIVTLVIALMLWFKENHTDALFFVTALSADAILLTIAKTIFHRARPLNTFVLEHSYSFPSGHALTAVIFFGVLTYILLKHLHTDKLKKAACILATITILISGASRVYLNAHWVSDVLAGYALGLFIFIIFVLWLKTIENKLSKRTGRG